MIKRKKEAKKEKRVAIWKTEGVFHIPTRQTNNNNYYLSLKTKTLHCPAKPSHLSSYDPNTGEKTKDAVPGRRIDPIVNPAPSMAPGIPGHSTGFNRGAILTGAAILGVGILIIVTDGAATPLLFTL